MPEKANTPTPVDGLLAALDKHIDDVGAKAAAAAGLPPANPPADEKTHTHKADSSGNPAPDPGAAATPAAKNAPAEPADDKSAASTDPDEPPANLSAKAAANWKELKSAKKAAQEEAAKLKADLAALQAKIDAGASQSQELETLRKTLEDYEQRLMVTALERHPKFQQHFDGQAQQLLNTAREVAGEHGDKFLAILNLPEGPHKASALRDAYAELDPVAQSQMGAVLANLRQLRSQRDSELSKARESWSALQEQDRKRQKAQEEQAAGHLERILNRWSDPKDGIPMLRPRENDPEWNKSVEAVKQNARDIFAGKLDMEGMARAAGWSAMAPKILSYAQSRDKEIERLTGEIEALKAARPSIDGGQSRSNSGDDLSGLGFLAALEKTGWR